MKRTLKPFTLAIVLMTSSYAFAQTPPEDTASESTKEVPAEATHEAHPAAHPETSPEAQATTPEAVPAEAAEETAETAGTTDPAPADATAGTIPPPPEGKGQVVFFREKKFAGAAINYKVRENDVELGKLSSGSYFIHVTDPGTHEYVVHSEAKDILNLEVEAGETYYAIGTITMGIVAGRPNLSPSDQATFESMAGKLKPAKPLDK